MVPEGLEPSKDGILSPQAVPLRYYPTEPNPREGNRTLMSFDPGFESSASTYFATRGN